MIFKRISLSVLAFTLSIISAFCYGEHYDGFVRYLYEALSANAVSFYGKGFHFSGYPYYLIVGIISVIVVNACFDKSWISIAKKTCIALCGFLLATFILSYIGTRLKIVECTACIDGKRQLRLNEVNYDLIFISSLVIASLPFSTFKTQNHPSLLEKGRDEAN
jgi:hypothetical protein